jgi:N-acetylglucosaminyldiphosphoundecaprenol N-acetyl-beta-D-mannosaminyltransferase
MSGGIRVGSFFAGDLDEAADAVIARAQSGRGGYACLANVHVVVTAQRDPDLDRALSAAWAVFPDGWPVAWLQRRLGHPKGSRVPGPDLMPLVVDRGQSSELRHFLFGATPEVLRKLEPPYGVIGDEAVEQINDATPDVIWCGIGAPKQELWMSRHAGQLAPAVVLGVGAAFDFLAGKRRRAPQLVQRFGLEWLHRLVSEPRRLWRRYAYGNLMFCALAARLILAKVRRG